MNAHCKFKGCRWSGPERLAVATRRNMNCPKCGRTLYCGSIDDMYREKAEHGKKRIIKRKK